MIGEMIVTILLFFLITANIVVVFWNLELEMQLEEALEESENAHQRLDEIFNQEKNYKENYIDWPEIRKAKA